MGFIGGLVRVIAAPGVRRLARATKGEATEFWPRYGPSNRWFGVIAEREFWFPIEDEEAEDDDGEGRGKDDGDH